MRISLMLIIIGAFLLLSGVLEKTRHTMGISRRNGLFFLFSIAAMGRFSIDLPDGGAILPVCILIPAWVFGHSMKTSGRYGPTLAALPVSAALAALLYPLTYADGEWTIYAMGLVSFAAAFVFGMETGLTTAGVLPPAACAAAYAAGLARLGWSSLEIGEACLSMQLCGMMFSVPAIMLRKGSRPLVRIRLAVRPRA